MAEKRRLVDLVVNGLLKFIDYGQGTYDDTSPARLLGVNATGDVVEFEYNAPPDPTDPVFYKAAGSVDSAGNAEQIAGATVSSPSVGRYDIVFSSAANSATYPVLATMGALPQNDDYQWAYLLRTINGFSIEIREQDNGGTAGVLVNSGFSFFVPVL